MDQDKGLLQDLATSLYIGIDHPISYLKSKTFIALGPLRPGVLGFDLVWYYADR